MHHAVNCYQTPTRFERMRLLRYKENPYIQKYKMKRSAPGTCANALRRGIERVKKRRSKQQHTHDVRTRANAHREYTLTFFFIPSPSLFLSSLLLHTLQSVMKEKAGSFGMGRRRRSEQNKQTSRSSTAGRRHRPRIFNKGDTHTHTH